MTSVAENPVVAEQGVKEGTPQKFPSLLGMCVEWTNPGGKRGQL